MNPHTNWYIMVLNAKNTIIYGDAEMSDLKYILRKSFFTGSGDWSSLLIPLGIGLAVFLVFFFLFFRRNKPSKNILLAILFMYLAVVASLTLSFSLPSLWRVSPKSTSWVIGNIVWVPFESARNIFRNAVNADNMREFLRVIGGNFVLLMPLGVLVPLINPRFRLGRMFLLSLFVPAVIEGFQLLNNILMGAVLRSVEVEDVLLNAAGCFLAYLIFAGLRRLFQPKYKAKHARR